MVKENVFTKVFLFVYSGKLSSVANPDPTGATNADPVSIVKQEEESPLHLGGRGELQSFTAGSHDVGGDDDQMFEGN